MPAFDRAFDAADERDAAVGCMRRKRTQVELTIVERNGQRMVASCAARSMS